MKRIILLLVVAWLQVAHAIVPEPRRLAEMPAISGAYELLPDGEVRTHDAAGAYYAQQTLEQMGHVPATPLIDAPRYSWRGLHVDVSRHFFTVADLRHLMDAMARLKLNRLHLHLTDGPGWRIEIKRYPRLTSEGAWRKKLGPGNWEWRDFDIGSQYPELYGGYYTQQEMRELVAYAAERHIVIVPEIDVPGHAYAALVAYPELSLLPPGVPIKECQVGRDVLAANHPRTVAFVKAVLDEIMALFPAGNPIHLGGDEVDVNLLSMETQRAFMQDLVDYVKQHGYQPITWDEAACNGVSGQWVMLWRPDAAEKVFAAGHPVILCPCSHFYFDYPQCRVPLQRAAASAGRGVAGQPVVGAYCYTAEIVVYGIPPCLGSGRARLGKLASPLRALLAQCSRVDAEARCSSCSKIRGAVFAPPQKKHQRLPYRRLRLAYSASAASKSSRPKSGHSTSVTHSSA